MKLKKKDYERLWKCKDGTYIKYKDLKDSHLLNILKFIENLSINGIDIIYGHDGFEADDMYCDMETMMGFSVLQYFNYNILRQIAKERKLI